MTGKSTVLVTGATSGIGLAVARRLSRDKMDVIALGRTADALQRLSAETGARVLAADVRHTAALRERLAGETIDAVVHCAGILSSRAPFQEIAPDEIDAMIATNLLAPLHLSRLVLPGMVERRRGHLVFIGSSAGRWPHPNSAVYGASKAGLSLFCDVLRCDLLGTRVRVTEIAPGRVETQLYRTALGDDAARRELYDGYAPLRPEDIAELVLTALRLPQHVDLSRLEVFPTDQAVGGARIVESG